MYRKLFHHLLKPLGQIRQNEAVTAVIMFLYSFLVMAAYNVIKPATRSKFIENLGPDNLPYVQLAAGVVIGFIMAAYSWLMARLPRRWFLCIAQGGIALVLLAFWLLFRGGQVWVSVAFYMVGLILGILLISQFWTLANVVFDPRQAKRLFGFIGGGSSLGGILGSFLAGQYARQLGTANLLLFSIFFMILSVVAVSIIVRREGVGKEVQGTVNAAEQGVSGKEALQMLRRSSHLRLIALVISFAAIGAAIIEQQLNMAAAAAKGQQATDAITVFLADVQLWTSTIGFLVQVLLTSRIHQHLGIGFALLMLPVSLGSTAVVMLLNAALWAPGLGRVIDQSLRYTVDKTTREVLYMPLPSGMKISAKPFVDVTVDRFAKGLAAVLLLILIKPWGLAFSWQQLSYASIGMTAIWIFVALQARRGYKEAFRKSFTTREIKPAEVTAAVADLSTIETLIQELASADEQRVVYAMEFLESLDKKHLITPLLLYHESPAVRARALSIIRAVQPGISARWFPAIQAMMADPDPEVRSEAVGALAAFRQQQVSDLVRPLLDDANPRIALTAAMVLASAGNAEDAARAEGVLRGLVSDTREFAAPVRRDFAVAIRRVSIPHFRRLLIPLLTDPNPDVADEAMRSTQKLGAADFIFVPTLVSLLRNRRQKSSARELLVAYGEPVLPILRHFLLDPEEDLWVRRHIPATIARMPSQKAMDTLCEALGEKDGFLRFQVIAALERLHRIKPELTFDKHRIESLIQEEIVRHVEFKRLHRALVEMPNHPRESLIARATSEKAKRGLDRIYRLLTLLYPWKEIVGARYMIEKGDPRSRAGTIEYLDNILGALRKTLIPLLEDAQPGGGESTLAATISNADSALRKLIHDENPTLASAAIYFVYQQRLHPMAEELDRMLAAPGARDHHVLETATWVLQELRRPAEKPRVIWLEPLPTVDLANQLRRLPLFESVTVDEVFRICATARQMRYEPGRLLCQEALVPENILFLLNGRVAASRQGGAAHQVEAPAVLAFQEVMEERPMAESVWTTDMAVCLSLSIEETRTLLSDNSDLVHGLFQMLCHASGQAGQALVMGHVDSVLPTGNHLSPVEKGLVLKSLWVFALVPPDEIIALASLFSEAQLTAGSDLIAEADRPAIYVLLSGVLSIQTDAGSPVLAGASDAIGIYETLAGVNFGMRARVQESGTALRLDREDLFDLLAQRSALLRAVFGALLRNRPAASAASGSPDSVRLRLFSENLH